MVAIPDDALTAFWVSFPADPSFPMGFGVTAWSDAHRVDFRVVKTVGEVGLDHVTRGAGPVVVRGIWFPCKQRGVRGAVKVPRERGLVARVLLLVAAVSCRRPTQDHAPAPAPAAMPSPTPVAPARPAAPAAPAPPSHSVIAHLRLSKGKFGTREDVDACQRLETKLEQDIEQAQVGEMDGNEIGEGECTLFMYGPDADKLFATIARHLRASRLARGGTVEKRYGGADDPAAREVRIKL